MSVQFDEENRFNRAFETDNSATTSGMAKWLIEKKITKDESGAKKIMVVVAIVCFALALYLIIK